MDEMDKLLLKLLLENGAMHTVEMAAALGMREDEIVSRMLRMQEEGLVGGTLAPARCRSARIRPRRRNGSRAAVRRR